MRPFGLRGCSASAPIQPHHPASHLGVFGVSRSERIWLNLPAQSPDAQPPGKGGGGVDREAGINSSEREALQPLPPSLPGPWPSSLLLEG